MDKPKQLWKTMDSLLSRNIPKSLPSACSPSALASSFLNFFNDKISNLCSSIPLCADRFDFADNPTVSPPPQLSSFHPVTEHEVRNIILRSTDSSCSLDLIPTKLLKSCITSLTPPITHLINLSLKEGSFQTSFKHAVVTPLKSSPFQKMNCLVIAQYPTSISFLRFSKEFYILACALILILFLQCHPFSLLIENFILLKLR